MTTEPTGATVTVTVRAATPGDSASRAHAIADLITAEFGQETRLEVTVGPDLADWNSPDDASYDPPTPAPGDRRDDTMRTAIRDALRAAAHSCDGDCGLTERVCIDAHPVQVAAWTHDIVSDLYGPIDAIADVVHAVRDREMDRLRGERDDALAEADADSRTLAEVDERCDTAMAHIRAVQAEIARIIQLPTVADDDVRADSFATGARWTLRMIHDALTGQITGTTGEERR